MFAEATISGNEGLPPVRGFQIGEAPALELLASLPWRRRGENLPLLFVHGAFAGAWCWAEHFLPFFAAKGHAAYAVSLRGHGGSEGGADLAFHGLPDYLDDVARAEAAVRRAEGRAPVLIGHSMGGFLVQKQVAKAGAPAAILMASLPPGGLAETSFHLFLRDPMLWGQLGMALGFGPDFADPSAMARSMFSPDFPEERRRRYYRQMQGESLRVLLDLTLPMPPLRAAWRNVPMMVAGAGRDAFLAEDSVRRTALFFGADLAFFPDMAHAMMLEADWPRVAESMLEWLAGLDE